MTRCIVLLFLLITLLGSAPLIADEDEVARAQAVVAKARERVETLKGEMAGLYQELSHDYQFLHSKRWAALCAPYLDAVALQSAALTAEPETDPAPALARAFQEAGLLSSVVSERLAAVVAKTLTGTRTHPAPEIVLAEAVEAVFTKSTFAACWEKSFLDLPLVVLFKGANEDLAAAERRLLKVKTSSGEKPKIPHGMVLIPRGRFIYGPWDGGWTNDLKSNKEMKVRVDAFFIDIHEVTNEDYLDFLSGIENLERKKEYLPYGFKLLQGGIVEMPKGQELWPVRGLTFLAATAYAESLGKRLPTEEEWEKAARGEDGFRWPWGNEFDPRAANSEESGKGRPVPVGSFPNDRSPFGVHDMAGNVSELTCTLDERRPYKGKLRGTDSIIYRGGNYKEGNSSAAATFRWITPAISGKPEHVGFRCVITEKAWKRMSR